jgi:Asp-tRNA(Asn)/Glu-tRNA(Gln) amidotransferase C subunit
MRPLTDLTVWCALSCALLVAPAVAQMTPPHAPPPSPMPSSRPPAGLMPPPGLPPSLAMPPSLPVGASALQVKIHELEIERFELQGRLSPVDGASAQLVAFKLNAHTFSELAKEQEKSVAELRATIDFFESIGQYALADQYRPTLTLIDESAKRCRTLEAEAKAEAEKILANSKEREEALARIDEIESELAELREQSNADVDADSDTDADADASDDAGDPDAAGDIAADSGDPFAGWESPDEDWPDIKFEDLTFDNSTSDGGENLWQMPGGGNQGTPGVAGGTPDPLADATQQELREFMQMQANWEAGVLNVQTTVLEGADLAGVAAQTVISYIPGLTVADVALSAGRGFAETFGQQIANGASFSEAAGKAALSGGFEGAISYVGNRLTAGADRLANRVVVLSDVGVSKLTVKQIAEMGSKGFSFVVVKTTQAATQIATSMMGRALGESVLDGSDPGEAGYSSSGAGYVGYGNPMTPVLR